VLIVQAPVNTECDAFGDQKGQPCWSLSRIELSGNRINLYDFDVPRLARDSFRGRLSLVHSVHRERRKDGNSDSTILFSADSAELGRFLESYVKNRGVFRRTSQLSKAPGKGLK
jgi:hypothetical protein